MKTAIISISKKQKRKRISGSGLKAKFEEVEKYLFVWLQDEREHKHQVNYTRLREKAQEVAEKFQIVNFVRSNKWIFNFFVVTILEIAELHIKGSRIDVLQWKSIKL